jgi:hypothetical protein
MGKKKGQPPTGRINSIREALEKAGPRPSVKDAQTPKKNYAERFSRNLATCFANALRRKFPGIMPTETGEKQESPARTAKGLKKLDVNYSTPQLGLALGVSIKSINFRDYSNKKDKVGRYSKNYSRNDNELRAEATDYHQRQPYAVLVAVVFLPIDSCDDAGVGTGKEQGISSFGACVRHFRPRANRKLPRDDVDLFERVFIALYEPDGDKKGETVFFDVMKAPPKNRRPRDDEVMTFDEMIEQIKRTYDRRNDPPFRWADDPEGDDD